MIVSDLFFNIPQVDVRKIDCGRARKEVGKPIRRLMQQSRQKKVAKTVEVVGHGSGKADITC